MGKADSGWQDRAHVVSWFRRCKREAAGAYRQCVEEGTPLGRRPEWVDIPDEEIVGLNMPTGIPLAYELEEHIRPIRSNELGEPEAVKQATEAVWRSMKKRNRPTQDITRPKKKR